MISSPWRVDFSFEKMRMEAPPCGRHAFIVHVWLAFTHGKLL